MTSISANGMLINPTREDSYHCSSYQPVLTISELWDWLAGRITANALQLKNSSRSVFFPISVKVASDESLTKDDVHTIVRKALRNAREGSNILQSVEYTAHDISIQCTDIFTSKRVPVYRVLFRIHRRVK